MHTQEWSIPEKSNILKMIDLHLKRERLESIISKLLIRIMMTLILST